MTIPTLKQFMKPLAGPDTVESAHYDAANHRLYVIGADGLLYTYSDVAKVDALHLLTGPARGMFASLTRAKWQHTVGPAPTA